MKAAAEDAASDVEEDRERRKARQREARRLQTEMRTLEGKIVKLEDRQRELDARLAEAWGPGRDRKDAEAMTAEAAALAREVEALYARWSAAGEALEAAGAAEAGETDPGVTPA